MVAVAQERTPRDFSFSLQNAHPRFAHRVSGLRYYSPELGRWASRDPIAEHGGQSLYASVRNDPVNRRDLLGLLDSSDGDGELSCMPDFPDIPTPEPNPGDPPGCVCRTDGSDTGSGTFTCRTQKIIDCEDECGEEYQAVQITYLDCFWSWSGGTYQQEHHNTWPCEYVDATCRAYTLHGCTPPSTYGGCYK